MAGLASLVGAWFWAPRWLGRRSMHVNLVAPRCTRSASPPLIKASRGYTASALTGWGARLAYWLHCPTAP